MVIVVCRTRFSSFIDHRSIDVRIRKCLSPFIQIGSNVNDIDDGERPLHDDSSSNSIGPLKEPFEMTLNLTLFVHKERLCGTTVARTREKWRYTSDQ
jgi:hypothetical protein